MRKTSNSQLTSLLVVALAMVASACTKSKELKNNVDPDAYVAKADFQGKTFHLSRGVEDADSDNTVGATPGMSDDFGLVKARITKDELQFISVFDPNGRQQTNTIVASYKITKQFDIQRDKNDYGNETNKIVEDTKNPWENRAYMRVDWAAPTNTLSKFAAKLSLTAQRRDQAAGDGEGGSGSYSEENTTLLENVKSEKGHMSFLVETSIKDPSNRGQFWMPYKIEEPKAFRVVYRTHLMEAKPSDFKPVVYSLKDFKRFGYFFTQQNIIKPEGVLDSNQTLFANMHNVCEAGRAGSCSTNKIVWNLSREFPEQYKETARRVIKEWNNTFKAALNRRDDVVILDESTEADISDPTKNVLAFYAPRTKSGLLGVAQWVSDPRTGELVGVRATVYGDGIDSVVARVNEKIDLLVSDDPLKDVIGTTGFGSPQGYVSPFKGRMAARTILENRKVLGLNVRRRNSFESVSPVEQMKSARALGDKTPDKASVRAMKIAAKAVEQLTVADSKMVAEDQYTQAFPKTLAGFQIPNLAGMEQALLPQAKIESDREAILYDAEHGIHGTELVEDAAIRYLYNFLKKGATKQDLEHAREKIKNEVAQLTYYTTALHEVGHAMGLRHNFAGSSDKAHYPQEYKDIEAKLANGDKSVAVEDLDQYSSSSIMDYTRDFFSQKNGLGSYDKAAIKYAYNRSINKEADPIVLANYEFCTDHEVGDNLLCQRFDKGHNASTMVQGDIDLYDHNYALWHYRRGRTGPGMGWGSPNGLRNTLLTRVFLPIRQTMDEFLYSFISAKPADGEGYCSMQFVKASVDAGEMANICGASQMEAARVDPQDMGTLVNALMKFDEKGNVIGAYKEPSQYIPYGLADLLYSNMIATSFFQQVLGSTEPGLYLAVPSPTGTTLRQLEVGADVKEQATAIAQEVKMDPALAQQWIAQSENFTTEIKVGGYGRPLESRTATEAGYTRNESIGSFWDKVAALQALSLPGGAFSGKYATDSINMNAYLFPQTKQWTSEILSKLITGNQEIAAVPVTLKNGRQIYATIPASTSLDVQSVSTFFSIAYMQSSNEKSILSKLAICNVNEAECSGSATGGQTIEVHAAQGNNVWRAVQTSKGDSISYQLLAQSKAIDDARQTWVQQRDGAGKAQAENMLLLDQSDALLAGVLEKIAADPALSIEKPDQQNTWGQLVPARWDLMKQFVKLQMQITPNQSTNVANAIYGVFATLDARVDENLKAMGDAGLCWVEVHHPEAIAQVENKKSAAQMVATLDAKANNEAVPATAVPAKVSKCPGVSKNSDPVDQVGGDEQVQGERRLNLLSLKADTKKIVETYMQKVIIGTYRSVLAPAQINSTTDQLARKEAQILQIRSLINAAKGE